MENVEKLWLGRLVLPKIWQNQAFFDKKFSTISTRNRVDNMLFSPFSPIFI
jgi:hypothetical protein